MTANLKILHSCSFCGKNQTQVKTLIAGTTAYICDECVNLCLEVIKPKMEEAQGTINADQLTPQQVVEFLDQHVIGQTLAKRTLAVAIRNHVRRTEQPEIDGVAIDKSNILLIGSSGVGKSLMVKFIQHQHHFFRLIRLGEVGEPAQKIGRAHV